MLQPLNLLDGNNSIKFHKDQVNTYGQLSIFFRRKIANIYLSISLNMCFGCSKEPSHLDGSFEYPQHMFWMRNEKNNFHLCSPIRGACKYIEELSVYDVCLLHR